MFCEYVKQHWYLRHNWPTLQRGLSAIAELLVYNNFTNFGRCLKFAFISGKPDDRGNIIAYSAIQKRRLTAEVTTTIDCFFLSANTTQFVILGSRLLFVVENKLHLSSARYDYIYYFASCLFFKFSVFFFGNYFNADPIWRTCMQSLELLQYCRVFSFV